MYNHFFHHESILCQELYTYFVMNINSSVKINPSLVMMREVLFFVIAFYRLTGSGLNLEVPLFFFHPSLSQPPFPPPISGVLPPLPAAFCLTPYLADMIPSASSCSSVTIHPH